VAVLEARPPPDDEPSYTDRGASTPAKAKVAASPFSMAAFAVSALPSGREKKTVTSFESSFDRMRISSMMP